MEKRKVIILIILCSLSFLVIGYMLGVISTIKAVVEVARDFIDINYDEVNAALFQYRNHIHNCYKCT